MSLKVDAYSPGKRAAIVNSIASLGARRIWAVVRASSGAAILIVAIVSVLFFVLRWLPGDPSLLILGDQASLAQRSALRAQLHLDEPIARQYAGFLKRLAQGELGPSFRNPSRDALDIVFTALGPTAALALVAVALGGVWGVGVALLTVGAKHWVVRASASRLLAVCSSVPLLAFAPAAMWCFALRLRLVPLPADPDAGVSGLLFSATLLAVPLGATVGRIARASLTDASRSQFLVVARAKGRSELATWIVHALPVCAGPIVTVIAAQLGALLGGAIVLERLFERHGLGTVFAEALAARDLPVIEGAVFVSVALFVIVQQLAQHAHAWIDPRVRSGE